MTTVLTSHVRRMLVFVLPHVEYCARLGHCACGVSVRRDAPRVPDSLTLPALATIEANDAVLSVSGVQSAIRKGDVTATPKPDKPAPRQRSKRGRT